MVYEIKYENDDGYCGGSRPHYCSFDSQDYMDDEEWNELSEETKQNYFADAAEEDFKNNHICICNVGAEEQG